MVMYCSDEAQACILDLPNSPSDPSLPSMCTEDYECGYSNFCVDQQCVDCMEDWDCQDIFDVCVDNACVPF